MPKVDPKLQATPPQLHPGLHLSRPLPLTRWRDWSRRLLLGPACWSEVKSEKCHLNLLHSQQCCLLPTIVLATSQILPVCGDARRGICCKNWFPTLSPASGKRRNVACRPRCTGHPCRHQLQQRERYDALVASKGRARKCLKLLLRANYSKKVYQKNLL